MYFKDVEQQVRSAFIFQNIDQYNIDIAQSMQNCTSVSLHIRRGDYISYGMSIVGKDYYEKAVGIVLKKTREGKVLYLLR